jgi:A/G-specific adenine glycosylase
VLSRIFAVEEPINSTKGKKLFSRLAQELLDDERAGLHNQAVMEFGALQCVPVSPDCNSCPASVMCRAYAQGRVGAYPVKEGKQKARTRFFNYFDVRSGDGYMLLNKRMAKDIWQGLYELPLIETAEAMPVEELQRTDSFGRIFKNGDELHVKYITQMKHVLSHQTIYATFYQITVLKVSAGEYLKVRIEDVGEYPVSRLVHKYLEKL